MWSSALSSGISATGVDVVTVGLSLLGIVVIRYGLGKLKGMLKGPRVKRDRVAEWSDFEHRKMV